MPGTTMSFHFCQAARRPERNEALIAVLDKNYHEAGSPTGHRMKLPGSQFLPD